MNKSIIISGPKGSGKTWIADAIALTHPKRRVLRTTEREVDEKMETCVSIDNVDTLYDLIIVEECSDRGQIHVMDTYFRFNHARTDDWKQCACPESDHPKYSVVFLTQADVNIKEVDRERFTVINCRNFIHP